MSWEKYLILALLVGMVVAVVAGVFILHSQNTFRDSLLEPHLKEVREYDYEEWQVLYTKAVEAADNMNKCGLYSKKDVQDYLRYRDSLTEYIAVYNMQTLKMLRNIDFLEVTCGLSDYLSYEKYVSAAKDGRKDLWTIVSREDYKKYVVYEKMYEKMQACVSDLLDIQAVANALE